jgi:hypothetical protein
MKAYIFKPILTAALVICNITGIAQVAAIKFTVHAPAISNSDKGVFLAGTFNYWHTSDTLYRMTDKGNGIYSLTIPVFFAKTYQYKYCLGTWDKVELAANDSDIANRRFTAGKKMHINDTVIKWKPLPPEKDSSVQLRQFTAMKDSLQLQMKPVIEELMGTIKLYAQNMLQPIPDMEAHHRLDDTAAATIGQIYRQITGLLWNICNALSTEQRQAALKKLNEPSSKDFLNTFLDAINSVAK